MDIPNYTLYRCFSYLLTSLLMLCSLAVNANDSNYSLALLTELPSSELKSEQWQFIKPLSGTNNHYFIASESGKIFTVNNDAISAQPLLDIRQYFPKRTITALTSLAIAPGFHLRNQFDHKTFYTAHVENADKTKNRVKISNDHNFEYDAVVTRWQLGNTVNNTSAIVKHREIIRIAVHKPTQHINQLSFAKHIKPWSDLFGLLYIGLKPSNKLDNSPLHSGVILRINPQQKANKNYTIPLTNPFIKMPAISNEVIFIANELIEKFDWHKKSNAELVILHNSSNGRKISLANNGDDWRQQQPKKTLWKDKNQNKQYTMISYNGRTLQSFWDHILLFGYWEDQWHLTPLILQEGTQRDSTLVQGENLLSRNATTTEVHLNLHSQINGELLFLEQTKQQLFELVFENNHDNSVILQSNSHNNTNHKVLSFVLLILIALCLVAFYLFYLKKNPQKQRFILQTQWTNLNFAVGSNEITLQKRGKMATKKILELSSLISSELLLNDEVIVVINRQAEHGYTNAIEDKLQRLFAKEHRIKMMHDTTRKIQIRITDVKKIEYTCCLYFRVSNIRHTKLKYSQTLEKVIEWNWYFSQIVNPSNTEKRAIKVESAPSLTETKNKKHLVTLHKKSQAQEALPEGQHQNIHSNDDIAIENIDTKLISALEHLVNLKKQGFLDDNEFNAAKKKVLQDFINK